MKGRSAVVHRLASAALRWVTALPRFIGMNRRYVTSPFAEETRATPRGIRPPVPVISQCVALGAAVASTVLLVAAGLVATSREEAMMSWWRGEAEGSGTIELLGLLSGLNALTNVVAFVATGVWLLGLRKVAEWAAPGAYHRRSAYWAVLGWVVPVVNLWFPYQVVADTSRALGSRVSRLWPWWLAWLALLGVSALDPGGELMTSEDLRWWIRTHQATAVAALVALALWWRVVRSATTAARRAGERD